MDQLIAHLCGDYVLQNHWMANEKTKRWFPAVIHATTYTLPFLLLTLSPSAIAVICGTHLVIDRFRLAAIWQEFWGVGCSGTLWEKKRILAGEMNHSKEKRESTFKIYGKDNPEWEDAPPWLKVWLLIIIDNTIHLTINYSALRWM